MGFALNREAQRLVGLRWGLGLPRAMLQQPLNLNHDSIWNGWNGLRVTGVIGSGGVVAAREAKYERQTYRM